MILDGLFSYINMNSKLFWRLKTKLLLLNGMKLNKEKLRHSLGGQVIFFFAALYCPFLGCNALLASLTYEGFSSVQMVFILELLMKAHLFKIGD